MHAICTAMPVVEQMADTIIELKNEGLAIFLSEQSVYFGRLVPDRICIREKCQIRWRGSMTQLMDNLDVQRACLPV
jgi:branched-chain amino acid transport system ATP-binding protein